MHLFNLNVSMYSVGNQRENEISNHSGNLGLEKFNTSTVLDHLFFGK